MTEAVTTQYILSEHPPKGPNSHTLAIGVGVNSFSDHPSSTTTMDPTSKSYSPVKDALSNTPNRHSFRPLPRPPSHASINPNADDNTITTTTTRGHQADVPRGSESPSSEGGPTSVPNGESPAGARRPLPPPRKNSGGARRLFGTLPSPNSSNSDENTNPRSRSGSATSLFRRAHFKGSSSSSGAGAVTQGGDEGGGRSARSGSTTEGREATPGSIRNNMQRLPTLNTNPALTATIVTSATPISPANKSNLKGYKDPNTPSSRSSFEINHSNTLLNSPTNSRRSPSWPSPGGLSGGNSARRPFPLHLSSGNLGGPNSHWNRMSTDSAGSSVVSGGSGSYYGYGSPGASPINANSNMEGSPVSASMEGGGISGLPSSSNGLPFAGLDGEGTFVSSIESGRGMGTVLEDVVQNGEGDPGNVNGMPLLTRKGSKRSIPPPMARRSSTGVRSISSGSNLRNTIGTGSEPGASSLSVRDTNSPTPSATRRHIRGMSSASSAQINYPGSRSPSLAHSSRLSSPDTSANTYASMDSGTRSRDDGRHSAASPSGKAKKQRSASKLAALFLGVGPASVLLDGRERNRAGTESAPAIVVGDHDDERRRRSRSRSGRTGPSSPRFPPGARGQSMDLNREALANDGAGSATASPPPTASNRRARPPAASSSNFSALLRRGRAGSTASLNPNNDPDLLDTRVHRRGFSSASSPHLPLHSPGVVGPETTEPRDAEETTRGRRVGRPPPTPSGETRSSFSNKIKNIPSFIRRLTDPDKISGSSKRRRGASVDLGALPPVPRIDQNTQNTGRARAPSSGFLHPADAAAGPRPTRGRSEDIPRHAVTAAIGLGSGVATAAAPAAQIGSRMNPSSSSSIELTRPPLSSISPPVHHPQDVPSDPPPDFSVPCQSPIFMSNQLRPRPSLEAPAETGPSRPVSDVPSSSQADTASTSSALALPSQSEGTSPPTSVSEEVVPESKAAEAGSPSRSTSTTTQALNGASPVRPSSATSSSVQPVEINGPQLPSPTATSASPSSLPHSVEESPRLSASIKGKGKAPAIEHEGTMDSPILRAVQSGAILYDSPPASRQATQDPTSEVPPSSNLPDGDAGTSNAADVLPTSNPSAQRAPPPAAPAAVILAKSRGSMSALSSILRPAQTLESRRSSTLATLSLGRSRDGALPRSETPARLSTMPRLMSYHRPSNISRGSDSTDEAGDDGDDGESDVDMEDIIPTNEESNDAASTTSDSEDEDEDDEPEAGPSTSQAGPSTTAPSTSSGQSPITPIAPSRALTMSPHAALNNTMPFKDSTTTLTPRSRPGTSSTSVSETPRVGEAPLSRSPPTTPGQINTAPAPRRDWIAFKTPTPQVTSQPLSNGQASTDGYFDLPVRALSNNKMAKDRMSLLPPTPGGDVDRPGFPRRRSKSLISRPRPTQDDLDLSLVIPPTPPPEEEKLQLNPQEEGGQQEQLQSPIKPSSKEKLNIIIQSPPPMSPATGQSRHESFLMSPSQRHIPKARSLFDLRKTAAAFGDDASPPPYDAAYDRSNGTGQRQVVFPREEEGKEPLPAYWCDIHLEGYFPRKMEFIQPGLQARDRGWKRVYFVLHGTTVKVFKLDPTTYAVPGEVDYPEAAPKPEDTNKPPAKKKKHGKQDPVHFHRGQYGSNLPEPPTHSRHIPSAFLEAKAHLPSSSTNHLIRQYSLQGAESGLAADYVKRKHVVRIRTEGEQFLIQARDDRGVIDVIEALQAGSNVALDLEQRQLPKFITLPRRRRRRRARPAEVNVNASTAAGTDNNNNNNTGGAEGVSGGEEVTGVGVGRLGNIDEAAEERPTNGNPRRRSRGGDGDSMDDMLAAEQDAFMQQSSNATSS